MGCIQHASDDIALPIVERFIRSANSHCGGVILGFYFMRYRDGDISGKSTEECIAGILWLYGRVSVRRGLTSLVDCGWLEVVPPDPYAIKDILYSHSRISDISNRCAWCKLRSNFIETHHWPVRAIDGGTDTVRICRTCHKRYHQIEMTIMYKPTDSSLKMFSEMGDIEI